MLLRSVSCGDGADGGDGGGDSDGQDDDMKKLYDTLWGLKASIMYKNMDSL